MQQSTFQTNVELFIDEMRSIRQNNRKSLEQGYLDLKNKPAHLSLLKRPIGGQRTFRTNLTFIKWGIASIVTLKVKYANYEPQVAPNKTAKTAFYK